MPPNRITRKYKNRQHIDRMVEAFLSNRKSALVAKAEEIEIGSDLAMADRMRSICFPAQLEVLDDSSPYIALMCPRRSGKTVVATIKAMMACVATPDSLWVICALTRPSAKRIYWRELARLSRLFDIKCAFNQAELEMRFSNGSSIILGGLSIGEQAEKFRGQQFDGFIVDEAGYFNPVTLQNVIDDIIGPALGDRNGQMFLLSTPGEWHMGPFYEASCTPAVKKQASDGAVLYSNYKYGSDKNRFEAYTWSFHTWSAEDNTTQAGKNAWKNALARKRANGWADDHPTWRREYLGEWVKESNILVYNVLPALHSWKGSIPGFEGDNPKYPVDTLTYVAGMDFGQVDGNAYVLWVYSSESKAIWEVESFKLKGNTVSEMAEHIKFIEGRLPKKVSLRVGDPTGGGRQFANELTVMHGLHVEMASKTHKVDQINLFNLILNEGLVWFQPGSALIEEMVGVKWNEKTIGTGNKRESNATPNDLSDAALYAFGHCWSRLGTEPVNDEEKGIELPSWARPPEKYKRKPRWESAAKWVPNCKWGN